MSKKVLMTGNEAMAESAILAGCRFYAGYPITPQNELTAYMAENMPKKGRVFIQAESEIAAINMVFGASVAGERAMTSSSSPGISLKQEGISYLAGCELPAVIVNVMRVGPGLGYITPAQGDYFQATKGRGHGDYHLIVLAPNSVQEASELTRKAFCLADRYRNPCMILTDAIIGQMMEPLTRDYTDKKRQIKKPWALTGCRGRQPRVIRSLFIDKEKMVAHLVHLQKKYEKIYAKEQLWEEENLQEAQTILVAYGSVARIAKEALRWARNEGMKAGMIRPISLWPFPKKAFKKLSPQTKNILVIEMSMGQMLEDVRLSLDKDIKTDFYGTLGGEIPQSQVIIERIKWMSKKR